MHGNHHTNLYIFFFSLCQRVCHSHEKREKGKKKERIKLCLSVLPCTTRLIIYLLYVLIELVCFLYVNRYKLTIHNHIVRNNVGVNAIAVIVLLFPTWSLSNAVLYDLFFAYFYDFFVFIIYVLLWSM